MHSPFIRLLLGIGATLGSIAVYAAEPAAKSEATPAAAPHTTAAPATPTTAAPATSAAPMDSETLQLPKIEVTAKRVKELEKEIKKLDKAIAREKKNLKASDLDKVLNNPKLAEAAVIFGGNSSAYLEEVAATRVSYMEAERDLLVELKQPRTLEDYNLLQKELLKMREMQRDLDRTSHGP